MLGKKIVNTPTTRNSEAVTHNTCEHGNTLNDNVMQQEIDCCASLNAQLFFTKCSCDCGCSLLNFYHHTPFRFVSFGTPVHPIITRWINKNNNSDDTEEDRPNQERKLNESPRAHKLCAIKYK